MSENTLYYGDNLDVLRRYVADESVDLVYLDPPFNSARDYNVLFESKTGKDSAAQIAAFEDTWKWDMAAAAQFEETLSSGGNVADVLSAFRTFLGTNDMLAYLTMMAPRLVELRRVLKPTGSLYLHCDPTASHYLKLLLDAVFGPEHFRNEIIWLRTLAKAQSTIRLPNNHDVILSYGKSDSVTWNADAMFVAYDEDNLDEKTKSKYSKRDENGRLYRLDNLLNPNPDRPNLTYEFLGVTRAWRWTRDRMLAAYEAGLVIQTGEGRVPQLKRYLDEQRGRPIGDVWTDIPPLNSQAAERLGYPTQKPVALLDRIIAASSNAGDTVLDPFCGCGTTIASAQANGRRWIGIDVTHLAVGLIRNRLQDSFGADAKYKIVGEPTTIEDAERLREEDKFQFQAWALGLVGARPSNQVKKGADKGIDGRLYFQSGEGVGKMDQVIISVKGGGLKADDLRALAGVVEREKAAIGVLMTFDKPSSKMKTDAASFGFHHTRWGNFPRIQILTVEELLNGARIQYPHMTGGNVTVKRAPKVQKADAVKLSLFES
jgi:site-specific DNA-methyltransferase (adenine-specific)